MQYFLNSRSFALIDTDIIAFTDPQTNSRFFKLPAELRNKVYKYVIEEDNRMLVPLDEAREFEPRIDLALTCRRMHNEAIGIHQAAYSKYWTDNAFKIDESFTYDTQEISSKHIQHMEHLVLRFVPSAPHTNVNLYPDTESTEFSWLAMCSVSPRASFNPTVMTTATLMDVVFNCYMETAAAVPRHNRLPGKEKKFDLDDFLTFCRSWANPAVRALYA